jgi:hypothetical protein
MTNTRRILLKLSVDFVERGKYYWECDLIVMALKLANGSLDGFIEKLVMLAHVTFNL